MIDTNGAADGTSLICAMLPAVTMCKTSCQYAKLLIEVIWLSDIMHLETGQDHAVPSAA